MNRTFKRIIAFMLVVMMLASSVTAVTAGDEGIRINNDAIGEGMGQVFYNCYWPYDFERWITKDFYPEDKDPSFTIRFEGTKISLYAHKNQSGGMAEVTIDGEVAGEIDYYAPQRENGQLLFASKILDEGEHTLTVRLTRKCNPLSNGNLEAAFEYAIVENVEAVEAESITLDYESLDMIVGDERIAGYTLQPANAAVESVSFESDDDEVVSVDAIGKIVAKAPGTATVTVTVDGTSLKDTMTVNVTEEPVDADPLRIDHDEIGEELYQVTYNCYWPHDNERWITKEFYPEDKDPAFTLRFEGTKVSLYGHTGKSGGMAEVTIDDEVAGEIDYYSDERKGEALLFESTVLDEGEHTLTVRLTRESNPAADGTLECSFGYALVENVLPIKPASIAFERETLTVATGSERALAYTVRPEDVNTKYKLVWGSDNADVLSVDENGVVKALKEGEATVTVIIEGTAITDTIRITVSDKVEYLAAMVGDEGVHRYANKYDQYLSSVGDSTEHLRTFSDYAWRGDTVNSRIDLLTKELEIKGAKLVTNELVSEQGDKIPASAVTVTYMDAPLMESVYQTTKDKYPFDIITHDTVRDLAAESVHCAWVNIDIPADAKPGKYTTTVTVVGEADGEEVRADFTYTVEVLDLLLPELGQELELWMYPYSAQRYYSGLSSEEYFGVTRDENNSVKDITPLYNIRLDKKYEEAFKSQLALYAKAGGDVITATVVEDAWVSQTPDPYPSMIKWIRKSDNTFAFDYTDFDYWVQLNMDMGIDTQINCYSMVSWGNTIVYYAEKAGRLAYEKPAFGSARWKELWTMFLTDFAAHLDEKGWFDITYMSMDERPLESVTMVLDLLEGITNKNGKKFKTSIAINNRDLAPILDRVEDVTCAQGLNGGWARELALKRAELGLDTKIYTCNDQNSSMESDPHESAEFPYIAYHRDTDGILRWALDAFNANPHETSYHTRYAAGDIYLIYPDRKGEGMQAMSSPRYEKLCEGIRDTAKLEYLRERFPLIEYELQNAVITHLTDAEKAHETIGALSRKALAGEINLETPDFLVLGKGESEGVELTLPADLEYEREIIDDASFSYGGDKWNSDENYHQRFFTGTQHYVNVNSVSAAHYYEFTFTGEAFRLMGGKGNMGMAEVFIDGKSAGKIDLYSPSAAIFTEQYRSELLEYGEHTVRVVALYEKNASSSAYQLQCDYAEVYTPRALEYSVDNDSIIRISEDGGIYALNEGMAYLTVKAGDAVGIVPVYVTEGDADAYKSALTAKADSIQRIEMGTKPVKTVYTKGEGFAAGGGKLTVYYKDGTSEELSLKAGMAPDYASNAVGEQRLTVRFMGHETVFTVTVNEALDAVNLFGDVKENDWFKGAVDYAVGHGLFNGMALRKFAPNTVMNRAMLVTVLYRMSGSPSVAGLENPFKDLKAAWYKDAVIWAAANNIVGGVGAGRFDPDGALTREQLATILYRYCDTMGIDNTATVTLASFPDAAKVQSWAKDAFVWAVDRGIIGGNMIGGVAHLDPQGKATRAQVATMLMRFCGTL